MCVCVCACVFVCVCMGVCVFVCSKCIYDKVDCLSKASPEMDLFEDFAVTLVASFR